MAGNTSYRFAKSRNREGKPLFSKENLQLGLLGVPGLFQPRKTPCCLACCLKKAGLKEWLMKHFEQWDVSVMSIVANGFECFNDVPYLVTEKQQRNIVAICQTMTENSADEDFPNVHENYYQAKKLQVFPPDSDRALAGSQFFPGQLLEIFFTSDSINILASILKSFKEQAWDVLNPTNVYPGLNYPHFDKCICICRDTVPFGDIFSPRESGDLPDRCDIILYELLHDAQRQLVLPQRVSLLIVDKITLDADNGELTGARDWINLISAVHSIDDLFLVFLVQAESFYEADINTFAEMHTMVNRGLSQEMRQRVLCLDLDDETLEFSKYAD